ncbi:hypothetical protein SAMN02745146_3069 [Hymenobacter daecheongensis DSM 21074]|uniref:Uncharacterized protein n=1 Tax=Hymenobacter daecheongensis DSM 21074 TaxID=1121955 RepID=A0A1M6J2N7_9BACT|nr:hypothetical protein [Hymenobacter daecheongensis]SHJ40948.1 hypothetical protein SAMN02745146_3069 [Hymenobacter daecheongensis DSM 21074]
MAHTRILSTGVGHTPKGFLSLHCTSEQQATPHSSGRVIAKGESGISLQVKCRSCGADSVYQMEQLPQGYQVYQVRITGEDGPHLPKELRPLPYLEESFSVVAVSAQDAHERAEFAHSLRLAGHLTQYYIDGTLHLDERF